MENIKRYLILSVLAIILIIKEVIIYLLFLLLFFVLGKLIPLPENIYILALGSAYGHRLFKGYEKNFLKLNHYLKVKGIKKLIEEKYYKD